MSNCPKVEVWLYDEPNDEDIFCFAEVTHYVNVKPNPFTWDSDLDFYGYTEVEYNLVNEQGNPLSIEVDEDTDEYIRNKIMEYYEDERE